MRNKNIDEKKTEIMKECKFRKKKRKESYEYREKSSEGKIRDENKEGM